MTALAGLWYRDGRPAAVAVRRMLAAQRDYGPDDVAQWADGGVALGRQLMRIVPEDRHDRQPLNSSDGRWTIVADVRLDNRAELARALDINAARAALMSDADFVLCALERWDEACCERLYGAYAFAAWHRTERRWLLVRDAMGGRPLHYFHDRRCLIFASMPRGLHALPEVPYAPDTALLAAGLDMVAPAADASCFQHVSKVPPGHMVLVDQQGCRTRRHWEPGTTTLRLRRSEDYRAALREELDLAVGAALRGADHVGTHLSGGLDSAAVTATAARLQATRSQGVTAYTAVPRDAFDGIGPAEKILDERELAGQTAALYANIDHVLVRPDGRSPLDALHRNFLLYEQPLSNLCNGVWLDAISDAAQARGLRVMLTGSMGNLSISYTGTNVAAALLRQGRPIRAAYEFFAGRRHNAASAPPINFRLVAGKVRMLMRGKAPKPAASDTADVLTRSLLRATTRAELRVAAPFTNIYDADPRAMRLKIMQMGDNANYAKGRLAHWQIDERDPTADRRLIEFCLSVPEEQFFRNGVPSALAREGLADRLPRAVRQGRTRGFQAADWYMGLPVEQLAAEVEVLARDAEASRLLDIPRLRDLVAAWPEADWSQMATHNLYRGGMLRALAFADFIKRASRSNG